MAFVASDPFPALIELLTEDKLEGRPWEDADFINTAGLVCRTHNCSSWLEPIVGTAAAWRDAYAGTRSALERFSRPSFDADEPVERVNEALVA